MMLNKCLLSTILLLSCTLNVFALDTDRQQTINIEADQAEQVSENGIEKITYTGNVKIIQGSMKIAGNKVTVYSQNREVNRVVAQGTPANFEQQSKNQEPPIKASAKTLDYQLSNNTILMMENASLTQGKSFVSGKTINFNLLTERVRAETRVKMVLEPQK